MIDHGQVEKMVEELDEEATGIEAKIHKFFTNVKVSSNLRDGIRIQIWRDSQNSLMAKRSGRRLHEEWQARAEELVEEYRPKRKDEFENHHRKIQENLTLGGGEAITGDKSTIRNETLAAFDSQLGIVRGVLGKVETERLRARRQISARLSKDEIERAWALFDDEFVRSAGVVAAVAVERELLTICEESDLVEEYDPTHGISRLAQSLYEAEVIDKTTWNDLKTMASIRETCAHAEEPKKHRVRRLISDAEGFVR